MSNLNTKQGFWGRDCIAIVDVSLTHRSLSLILCTGDSLEMAACLVVHPEADKTV